MFGGLLPTLIAAAEDERPHVHKGCQLGTSPDWQA
jgi:hypothetical protein